MQIRTIEAPIMESLGNTVPTHCSLCDSEISRELPAVVQKCACMVAICHECALQQLSVQAGTFTSHLVCPVCAATTSVYGGCMDLAGIDEAITVEWELLQRALRFFNLKVPTYSRKDSADLQTLADCFYSIGFKQANSYHLSELHISVQRLRLAQMETMRAGSIDIGDSVSDALDEFDHLAEGELPLGPLKCISFHRNQALERLVLSHKSEIDDLDAQCCICGTAMSDKPSAPYSCECAFVACQSCAVRSLSNLAKTYTEGTLQCFQCRQVEKDAFQGVECAIREEEQLFFDACAEVIGLNTRKRFNANTTRKWGWEFLSLHKEFNLTPPNYTLPREHFGAMSLEMLRLEVARVWLYRKAVETTGHCDRLPDGPLSLLRVRSNVFLDIYLKHSALTLEDDLDAIDWSQLTFNPEKALRTMQQTPVIDRTPLTAPEEIRKDRFVSMLCRNDFACSVAGCGRQFCSEAVLQSHANCFHPTSRPVDLTINDYFPLTVKPMATLSTSLNQARNENEPVDFTASSTAIVENVLSVIETDICLAAKDQAESKEDCAETIVQSEVLLPLISVPVSTDVDALITKTVPASGHQSEVNPVICEKAIQEPKADESEEANVDEEQFFLDSILRERAKIAERNAGRIVDRNSERLSSVAGTFRVFDGLDMQERYELVFTLPTGQVEGLLPDARSDSNGFCLEVILRLHANDQQLNARYRESELKTHVNVYTNKMTLQSVRTCVKTQCGCSALILKFRDQLGRMLHGARSLSYYHIVDGSSVVIQPLSQECQPSKSFSYPRKRCKPSHAELAVRYALEKKLQQSATESDNVPRSIADAHAAILLQSIDSGSNHTSSMAIQNIPLTSLDTRATQQPNIKGDAYMRALEASSDSDDDKKPLVRQRQQQRKRSEPAVSRSQSRPYRDSPHSDQWGRNASQSSYGPRQTSFSSSSNVYRYTQNSSSRNR